MDADASWLCKMLRRVGHRGAFLLFLVILDETFGYSLFSSPPHAIGLFHMMINVRLWVWIWVGTGVFIATGIPARWDRVQYAVAALVKAGWAAEYVNLQLQGYPRAWATAVVWACFAATTLLIASWPESPDILSPPPPEIRRR